MSFFSKPTYKEVSLPFIHDCYADEYAEYLEAGCIDIEAYTTDHQSSNENDDGCKGKKEGGRICSCFHG